MKVLVFYAGLLYDEIECMQHQYTHRLRDLPDGAYHQRKNAALETTANTQTDLRIKTALLNRRTLL